MSATRLDIIAQLVLAGTFVALMLADAFTEDRHKRRLSWLGGVGVVAALVLVAIAAPGLPSGPDALRFNHAISVDRFSAFFQVILMVLTLLGLAVAPGYLDRQGAQKGEFYILLLAALIGMVFLTEAASLVTVFIGIELLSLALYVLSGLLRQQEASQEAALKYLLIGGFASSFLLFGIALVYGATGTTDLGQISQALPGLRSDNLALGIAGMVLLLVGLGFKASAAPFHVWTPDVYQGAPSPVVAFMSGATKLAALGAFLRIFSAGFQGVYGRWALLLGALAAVSMLVGAVGALRQSNIKRLLAYSGVAQSGYLLMAVVAGNQSGMVGGLYYLVAYGLMTFGAFGVITLLRRRGVEMDEIDGLKGIGFQQPVLGGLLALFLFSLAGIPLTAGFMGKLFVFVATIRAGYVGLAVIAIVTSAIALYYYVGVVMVMYSRPNEEAAPAEIADPAGIAAVAVAGALTILLGIFPSVLYGWAQRASLL